VNELLDDDLSLLDNSSQRKHTYIIPTNLVLKIRIDLQLKDVFSTKVTKKTKNKGQHSLKGLIAVDGHRKNNVTTVSKPTKIKKKGTETKEDYLPKKRGYKHLKGKNYKISNPRGK